MVRFVEDDAWYAECPVVVGFESEQVEICHQRFDDLSITFNTIDCDAPITGWQESEFTPVYRFDDDQIVRFRDQVLRQVALLEWRAAGDMADGMVAVEFTFEGGRFAIANGLDENMIELGGGSRSIAVTSWHLMAPDQRFRLADAIPPGLRREALGVGRSCSAVPA